MKHLAPQIEDTEVWSDEERNPENWLRIPNFGVIPAPGLDFRGYIGEGPARFPELSQPARSLVRAARKLLRQTFSTMGEVRTAWDRFLAFNMKSETTAFGTHWPPLKQMRAAAFYNLMIGDLERCLRATKRQEATKHMLQAIQSFADWTADDDTLPLPERMRLLQARRKLKGSPEALVALANDLDFPMQMAQKDFVLSAAEHFQASPRQVERWLAAARAMKLMT